MFLISGPELVAACCMAGIVGTLPALNQRTTEGLGEWLTAIKERCAEFAARAGASAAPYGVNLIVHRSNPRLAQDLECCVQHRVPLIVTSLGAAREVVEKVHGYGGLVFHDVTTTHHARKAVEAGADGLIAVAAGAGGHAGTTNPFALVAEIRAFFAGTVLLAGAISTGRDIVAAQALGADLAYLGTRFLATRESLAPGNYKTLITASSASDIVYTSVVSGVPANFLQASLAAGGIDLHRAHTPRQVDFGTELEGTATSDSRARPWRDLWSAGQGVGAINDVPDVASLVARLEVEYREAATAFAAAVARYRR